MQLQANAENAIANHRVGFCIARSKSFIHTKVIYVPAVEILFMLKEDFIYR